MKVGPQLWKTRAARRPASHTHAASSRGRRANIPQSSSRAIAYFSRGGEIVRLKVAALVGVVLFGLLAIVPPLATAPVAEEDFEECADNDVCFTVLLTNEEVFLSGPGIPFIGFDTWLYVTNPSEDITRSFFGQEDNVVVQSVTVTRTHPDGSMFEFLLTPEDPPRFADRWDPVVHASETKRVVFFGAGFSSTGPLGFYHFEYELAMTFRGESFTLSVEFEIELVSLS